MIAAQLPKIGEKDAAKARDESFLRYTRSMAHWPWYRSLFHWWDVADAVAGTPGPGK